MVFVATDALSAALLAPLVDGGVVAPAPWRVVLLPKQTAPHTTFNVATIDGEEVLQIDARASYGNLVHPLPHNTNASSAWLSWRWRVEQFADGSDLRHKAGDDTALKVCALYDLPLASVPFFERLLLRLARLRSGENLPGAVLCYVWDRLLPPGRELPNAYTRRVRYVVLQGPPAAAVGEWRTERRDLNADFLRVFGDNANDVPPLVAIAVGADADNTKSRSLAYLSRLRLETP
jgi:hypothetical protein